MAETFDLDGRLSRTLKLLFRQPGFLASEFSLNRRASYVSPFRLYLFASLIFFFCLSVSTDRDEMRSGMDPAAVAETEEKSNSAATSGVEKVKERADPEILKSLLSPTRAEVLERLLGQSASPAKRDILNGYGLWLEQNFSDDERADNAWWLAPSTSKLLEATEKPERLMDEFSESIPLAMFILLPAYALFLKLLFYSRSNRFYYSEHLVFAIHLHVLAFLIFALNLLLPDASIVGEIVFVGLFLYLGVYAYRAMLNYYKRSQLATFWRFALLGVVYSALFLPALGVVMIYAFIAL